MKIGWVRKTQSLHKELNKKNKKKFVYTHRQTKLNLRKNRSSSFVVYYSKIKFKKNKQCQLVFYDLKMKFKKKMGYINLFFYYSKNKI